MGTLVDSCTHTEIGEFNRFLCTVLEQLCLVLRHCQYYFNKAQGTKIGQLYSAEFFMNSEWDGPGMFKMIR